VSRVGVVLGLFALVGCGLFAPEPVTTVSPIAASAGELTIEVVAPLHADYTNVIRLDSPAINLEMTNHDIGATRSIEVEEGQEIVVEIQPLLDGSPVSESWRSGSSSRNSDGESHALLTTLEDSLCVLVSFEDQPADSWGDHPDEPDYGDVLLWIYPTVSPPYETSQCPQPPVEVP
jgi:hypothetical protein